MSRLNEKYPNLNVSSAGKFKLAPKPTLKPTPSTTGEGLADAIRLAASKSRFREIKRIPAFVLPKNINNGFATVFDSKAIFSDIETNIKDVKFYVLYGVDQSNPRISFYGKDSNEPIMKLYNNRKGVFMEKYGDDILVSNLSLDRHQRDVILHVVSMLVEQYPKLNATPA